MTKRYLNSPRKALCENAASVRACMWLCARFKTALFIVVCVFALWGVKFCTNCLV